jgi:hypothetical protein
MLPIYSCIFPLIHRPFKIPLLTSTSDPSPSLLRLGGPALGLAVTAFVLIVTSLILGGYAVFTMNNKFKSLAEEDLTGAVSAGAVIAPFVDGQGDMKVLTETDQA